MDLFKSLFFGTTFFEVQWQIDQGHEIHFRVCELKTVDFLNMKIKKML
jgi:hypothetical protein